MRGLIKASLFPIFTLLTATHVARAQDAAPDSQVVVTATRIPTPAAQVASSITVITAEEIAARQQRTLPEVLEDVPGLNVVQSGGAGALTSIFMRGTNSNHTKVLVDGIDVSDPSNPSATFDFGQFLTQDIERVEILRGPQSGLYGSDAIGGVINIITKSGSGPAQFTGSVEGGSFDTFNQFGSLSGSTDQFHYSANIEHLHAGETPVTPLNLLAPGEARIDDYYDNLTASTKLGYDLTSDFSLGLVARYTDTHLRDTGENYDTVPDSPAAQQSDSDTTEYYGRLSARLQSFAGFLDQTVGLAYTRNTTLAVTPDSPNTLDTGERTKLDWQGALKFSGEETVVLGAEHARDEITQPLSASMSVSSGYAELQSQLTHGLYTDLNVRYDDNSTFGGKVTYRFAPTYVIEETDTKLKASIGTGFKAPTLSELFQSFPPYFFANPDLKPESSTGWDAGFEQGFAHDAVRFGATYFYNRIHDLIDTSTNGLTYANIGRATTEGVESFLAYRPLQTLTLRLDYTYTEAYDDILQEELLRRPKHKGTLNAAWQASSVLSLNATVLSVSSWIDGNRDFSIPRLTAPGYTVVNLAANYELSRQLELFARVDNLFDRHYQNPVGFLQPSIGAFAGIKVKL